MRRPTVRHLASAIVVLVVAGCASGSPSPSAAPTAATPTTATPPASTAQPTFADAGPILVDDLRIEVDVPYTSTVSCGGLECAVPTDILAPVDAADLPTFVVVPGGPVPFVERRYMESLAVAVARRGGVVFLISYRSEATGESWEESGVDIRCAIRYARAETTNHGGDPGKLIVVGHSLGGEYAITLVTSPVAETPDCLAQGDGVPESVVALAGFPLLFAPNATDAPPLWLGAAELDAFSDDGPGVAKQLRGAGFSVEYKLFPGARHEDMVQPATSGLLDFIFDAADGADAGAPG